MLATVAAFGLSAQRADAQDLQVSFNTGTLLAYGSWNTSTLAQSSATVLPTTGDVRGLAVDLTGNVYVGRVDAAGAQSLIYKYDPSGTLLATSPSIGAAISDFTITPVPEPTCLLFPGAVALLGVRLFARLK